MTPLGDGEVVEQVISQQTAEPEEVTIRRSSLLDEAIRQLQAEQDRQNPPGTEAVAQAGAGPFEQAEAHGLVLAPAPSTPRRGISTPPVLYIGLFIDKTVILKPLTPSPENVAQAFNDCFSLQCLLMIEQMCSLPPTWACVAADRWRASGRCTRTLPAARWPQRETCRPGDAGW